MAVKRRRIELFTAGCFVCDEAVKIVKDLACPDCEVTVYDIRKEGIEKAKGYGVSSVPTIVVDGRIAECCVRGRISAESLKAAGIGQRL